MVTLDRVLPPSAFRVSTAVMAVVGGWFTFTFAVTVVGLLAGA